MNHEHNYKTINENSEGKLEICIECKKRNVVKFDVSTGRVDNKKYLKEHKRDVLQPYGRTSKLFKKYYGDVDKDLRFK